METLLTSPSSHARVKCPRAYFQQNRVKRHVKLFLNTPQSLNCIVLMWVVLGHRRFGFVRDLFVELHTFSTFPVTLLKEIQANANL